MEKVFIEWHDVEKEGFPTEEGEYIVTRDGEEFEKSGYVLDMIFSKESVESGNGVIAWAKLPEPYRKPEKVELSAEVLCFLREIKKKCSNATYCDCCFF